MIEAKRLNPRHHIDKAVAPLEKEGVFPIERETKIKFIGTRDEFVAQMTALQARLIQDTRIIDDLRFTRGQNFEPASKRVVDERIFEGPDGLDEPNIFAALRLLGFEVLKNNQQLELVCPPDLENKTIRIRNDGGEWIFTAKRRLERLDENGYIEEKPEVEVELNDPTELRRFLEETAGLELDSHRQKLRTSYKLKTGQLVELNESPAFETHGVPFWLEIEGGSMAEIEAAASMLGYNKSHFFKGSDKKFLMVNGGLSEAETKTQLF